MKLTREAAEDLENEALKETWGVTHCEICGEKLTLTEEIAEMYNPEDECSGYLDVLDIHKIGHIIHLQEGWEMA